MPIAKMRFIKRCAEFIPKEKKDFVPNNTRGIYFLLKKNDSEDYSVIYVGMARGNKSGIHSRLNSHARSKTKASSWTHFSFFEVHDNISVAEIEELEGTIRHFYRYDLEANPFNQQRKYKKLKQVTYNKIENW